MTRKTLQDYRRALDAQRTLLFAALADGVSSAFQITALRISITLMEEDLQQRPGETVNINELRATQVNGADGPFLWSTGAVKRAEAQLRKYEPTDAERIQKHNEYAEFMTHRLATLNVKTHTGGTCDVGYFMTAQLVTDPDDKNKEVVLVELVKAEFRRAVEKWIKDHAYDPAFYKEAAVVGVARAMEEQQDIALACRIAQDMGTATTPYKLADPSLAAEVTVGLVECLPFIGNALTLIEVAEGRDLFCRPLSPVERVLMGAMVLVPAVTKVVKGGKAVYTAARLEYFYGKAKWSKFLNFAELMEISHSPKVKLVLKQAGQLVKAKQAVPGPLLKEAEQALATLAGKSVSAAKRPIYSAADRTLLEALQKIGAARAVLTEIDYLSLKRVADKAVTKHGLNVDLAKGQLLEEFKESRTVRLLQQHFASNPLGLEPGKVRFQYFPGHLLTDSSQVRGLTDGIVARQMPAAQINKVWYGQRPDGEIKNIQGVLDILAIDEAKAGKSSARDLRYIRDVTEADREALKAVAAKRFLKAQQRAKNTGKPLQTTLEKAEQEVSKEYKMGEFGGQARLDLERLDAFEDGSLPSIFVGDLEYLAFLRSGTRTKIFGVLPKDVAKASEGLARRLQRSVKEGGEGLNFEILGVNITASELTDLAKEVLKAVASGK